jgi:hypothetical protein
MRLTRADQVADYDEASSDPDPTRQSVSTDLKSSAALD